MEKLIPVFAAFLLLVLVIIAFLPRHSYCIEVLREDPETGELTLKCVKKCTCIGSLETLESYPPQYRCIGLEVCGSQAEER